MSNEPRIIGVDLGAPGGAQSVLSCAVLVCPFCGGQPCALVGAVTHPFGEAPRLEDYGDDGLPVRAYVFCHSCGSEGPDHEADLFELSDYQDAKLQAIKYWNTRGHHPELEGRQWTCL